MSDNGHDVLEWVRFAKMDYNHALKSAEIFHPVPIEIVCFHAQQSAEKALKAYLIAHESALVRTHDLEKLLEYCLVFDERFEAHRRACISLSTYASLTRYPSSVEVTEAQMKDALLNMIAVVDFTTQCLRDRGFTIEE